MIYRSYALRVHDAKPKRWDYWGQFTARVRPNQIYFSRSFSPLGCVTNRASLATAPFIATALPWAQAQYVSSSKDSCVSHTTIYFQLDWCDFPVEKQLNFRPLHTCSPKKNREMNRSWRTLSAQLDLRFNKWKSTGGPGVSSHWTKFKGCWLGKNQANINLCVLAELKQWRSDNSAKTWYHGSTTTQLHKFVSSEFEIRHVLFSTKSAGKSDIWDICVENCKNKCCELKTTRTELTQKQTIWQCEPATVNARFWKNNLVWTQSVNAERISLKQKGKILFSANYHFVSSSANVVFPSNKTLYTSRLPQMNHTQTKNHVRFCWAEWNNTDSTTRRCCKRYTEVYQLHCDLKSDIFSNKRRM